MFATGDYIRWGATGRSKLGMIICRVAPGRHPSDYGYKVAEIDDATRTKDSYVVQGARPGAALEYHWPLVSSLHPAGDISTAERGSLPVFSTVRITYKGTGVSKIFCGIMAIPFLLAALSGIAGTAVAGVLGLATLAGTVIISGCYGVILEENDLRYGFLRRKQLAYSDIRQLDRLPGLTRQLRVETTQGRRIFITKSDPRYDDIAAQLRLRSGCLCRDV